MGAEEAGRVFSALFLVLFPAVQLSSSGCVTYNYSETCGFVGSSVEFPCSYPQNVKVMSISGWSRQLYPHRKLTPLEKIQAYSNRIKYLKRGNNDCTMKLTGLRKSDTSNYYFIYKSIKVTGHPMTCKSVPAVRLHIVASPVSILVKKLVNGQDVAVADCTVMEGQRIMLTCVSTCAANLNSNPGYIWYKNNLQLSGSRANSPFLSLENISVEDTGSYVCTMILYKNLPSSVVNLRVRRKPRNTVVSGEIPDAGSEKDSVPTLTHVCDAQNNTDQIFNNCRTPFTLFIMLLASVSVGLVITILAILVIRAKKKKDKKMRCAGPNHNRGSYMVPDINSMSAEYNTLDPARRYTATHTVYENLRQPGKWG
ncbi:uncharacterized protein LOC127373353 [Dicentrarchus labrax]|uniref:uncharacterized protein LOC127373353 n=1 Tax=Dicentrarchus labrax TaxID=13489 RepID=UPI0021F67CC2|nr:uncharacterized protein LOC127373353 [Dicentrarchus labrax]